MAFEYISTYSNRVYILPPVAEGDNSASTPALAPITKLSVKTKRSNTIRQDKTGVRSELAMGGRQREIVDVTLSGYGTGGTGTTEGNAVLSPFSSALCSALGSQASCTVTASTDSTITLTEGQTLEIGDGVSFGSEVRFVTAKLEGNVYQLIAPFRVAPIAGDTVQKCASLKPGNSNIAFGLLDSWDPDTSVQRLLTGVQANTFEISINNDFLEYTLQGYALKVVDSVNNSSSTNVDFASLKGAANSTMAMPIAGHLGQVWIGDTPTKVCTLTQATIRVDNGLVLRNDEFGCYDAKSTVLGRRSVTVDLALYQKNDTVSQEIYQKSINNQPVSVMLQIGNTPGSMFAVYLPAILFEPPQFDDSKERVIWQFKNGLAQGGADDDIFLAFA